MHQPTPENLLSMSGICKSFGPVTVLEDVNLEVKPGELHVLAGENGAGKSTLIKILGGVYTRDHGEVLIEGKAVNFSSIHDATAAGVGIIHQELSLVGELSVVENIFLGREITKFGILQKAQMRQTAQELLAKLDLYIDVTKPVEHYPIGTQQMIEICKALSLKSKILVMDEPTSALTEPEVEKLFKIIDQLKSWGVGIIYISHKMEELYKIADTITVLRDGEYIGTAPASELPQSQLIHWMVGRELADQFPRRRSNPGKRILNVENFTVPNKDMPTCPLVNNASFHVREGEIFGLAGLEGSGNSALLNGLFGTYGNSVQGTIQFAEKHIKSFKPSTSIKSGMALVTNDRKKTGLVMGMSIIENASLAALAKYCNLGILKRSQERTAVEQSTSSLKLKAASLDMDVNNLSGGNQQKVVLSKWLQTNPRLLMLDDPTRGVDIGAKHEIYELLNQLTDQGIAIVLVSSEMDELLTLADRIAVMHRGEITLELTHENATPQAILKAAMGQ